LDGYFPSVPSAAIGSTNAVWNQTALMSQLSFNLNFNHPCGFFSQFQSLWISQINEGYYPALTRSSFWQHNYFAGYRFFKRRASVQFGVLNLTGVNYQLNPLNLYSELPRKTTFVAKFQFAF
jgi:hypothetical protein